MGLDGGSKRVAWGDVDAELLACLQKMSQDMTILMVTSHPSYLQVCNQIFKVTRDSFETIPCPVVDQSAEEADWKEAVIAQ